MPATSQISSPPCQHPWDSAGLHKALSHWALTGCFLSLPFISTASVDRTLTGMRCGWYVEEHFVRVWKTLSASEAYIFICYWMVRVRGGNLDSGSIPTLSGFTQKKMLFFLWLTQLPVLYISPAKWRINKHIFKLRPVIILLFAALVFLCWINNGASSRLACWPVMVITKK